MPTHRVLQSVANDVAQSLASRNDDLAGYWALGQLLAYALAHTATAFLIDLTCAESRPSLEQSPLSRLPAQWSEVFWQNVAHKKLPRADVARASVRVAFDFVNARPGARDATVEYPVALEVSIEDDRGRTYVGRVDLWCAPHDPTLELKSARYVPGQ